MDHSNLPSRRGASAGPTLPPANDKSGTAAVGGGAPDFNTGCMAYFETSTTWESPEINPVRKPTVRQKKATTVEKMPDPYKKRVAQVTKLIKLNH